MSMNPLLKSDSYKHGHFLQYPPGTKEISSYISARKNADVLFFGIQIWLKNLEKITHEHIDEAEEFLRLHGSPFNREGWEIIVNEYGGYLPLLIEALDEGTMVPKGVPQVQIRSTDSRLCWLTSWIESSLLRGIWYPTTVATISRQMKKKLYEYLLLTADDPKLSIQFMLHDFGARGVSSSESAGIGGAAHLVNFRGSDTLEGIYTANKYYNALMSGFSVPASEHSTITSWGKAGEVDAYRNMLNVYEKYPIVSVVSDSYDIYNACRNIWGGELASEVRDLGNNNRRLVIRPDSGNPALVVPAILQILREKFGGTYNSKGYRVLPSYLRILQGDGIDSVESVADILRAVYNNGFSAENLVFGMGGALLQKVNRDTFSFAMKANAIVDKDGVSHDIFKNPVDDAGKASLPGRQVVLRGEKLYSVRESCYDSSLDHDAATGNLLKPVFLNGEVLSDVTFNEIINRADKSFYAEL